jgi:hypothetical protein
MRWVLLVGVSGVGLIVTGIAIALARWDFTMEGGGDEAWFDYLPFFMVPLGFLIVIFTAVFGVALFVARRLNGPSVSAKSSRRLPPP